MASSSGGRARAEGGGVGERQAAGAAPADIGGGTGLAGGLAVRRMAFRQTGRVRRAEQRDGGVGGGQGRRRQGARQGMAGIAGDHDVGGLLQQIGRGEQGRHRGELVLGSGEGADDRLGAGSPHRIAGEVGQPGEYLRHDAIARRSGVVAGGAWARQGNVGGVGGAGEEAAVVVREKREGGVGEADRLGEARRVCRRLEQGEGGAGHRRLVVEQPGGGDAAETPGVMHSAIGAGQLGHDEIEGALGAG